MTLAREEMEKVYLVQRKGGLFRHVLSVRRVFVIQYTSCKIAILNRALLLH